MTNQQQNYPTPTIEKPLVFECAFVRKKVPVQVMWQPIRARISPVVFSDESETGQLFKVVAEREWSDGNRTREIFRFSTLKAAISEAKKFVTNKRGKAYIP